MSTPTQSDELLMELFEEHNRYMALLRDEQFGILNDIGHEQLLVARRRYIDRLKLACETGYALTRRFGR